MGAISMVAPYLHGRTLMEVRAVEESKVEVSGTGKRQCKALLRIARRSTWQLSKLRASQASELGRKLSKVAKIILRQDL